MTSNTKTEAGASDKRVAFSLTYEQVQALYLTLLRRERPAFGWIEEPLVAIEAALRPAHDAIHDRGFNSMNRQFFGDNRFEFEEGAMPSEISPVSTAPAPQADAAPLVDGLPPLPAPLEIDWPELHSQALGCGVEDRNIRDRYEAAEYGWQDGVDRAAERVPEEIFTADQMREYARAAIAAGGAQEPYAHVYEYDTAFGLHRQFEPGTYNGANPSRTVKVYAATLPREAATLALTDEQREALEYAVEMTRRDTSWRSDEYRPVIEALLAAASNGEQA